MAMQCPVQPCQHKLIQTLKERERLLFSLENISMRGLTYCFQYISAQFCLNCKHFMCFECFSQEKGLVPPMWIIHKVRFRDQNCVWFSARTQKYQKPQIFVEWANLVQCIRSKRIVSILWKTWECGYILKFEIGTLFFLFAHIKLIWIDMDSFKACKFNCFRTKSEKPVLLGGWNWNPHISGILTVA